MKNRILSLVAVVALGVTFAAVSCTQTSSNENKENDSTSVSPDTVAIPSDTLAIQGADTIPGGN